jgi:serine protease Do
MKHFITIILLLAVMLTCEQCVNAKSKPWPTPAGVLTKQEIIAKFLPDEKNMDAIEGIWTTDDGTYEIAIIKNTFNDNPGYDFIGIITNAVAKEWKCGQLKALFKKTADSKLYPGIWYWRDRQDDAVGFRMASRTEIKYTLSGTLLRDPTSSSLIRVYPTVSDEKDPSIDQNTVSSGTGFAICPDLIVTSYHVIAQRPNIQVTSMDGTVSKGSVVVKDIANDLALIKVSTGTTFSPVPLGKPCDAKSGGKVFTIGFPLTNELGSNAKIGEGIINSLTGIDDDPRMYQISIPIQPGNSGGPLLDDKGNVIGIVAATLNNKYLFFFKDAIAQNVNFAVKTNYLDNMLAVLPGQPQPTQGKGDTVMDATQILETVRKSIVFVTAQSK